MYKCPACKSAMRMVGNKYNDPIIGYYEILECVTCLLRWRVFQRLYRLPEPDFYAVVVAQLFVENEDE